RPEPRDPEAHQQVWIRSIEPIGEDARLQQVVMAYASDLQPILTSLRTHDLGLRDEGVHPVSLDNAIWFHRPTDFHSWHLYDMACASTSGGRGLNRGAFYTADGVLTATTVQEGLIRMRPQSG